MEAYLQAPPDATAKQEAQAVGFLKVAFKVGEAPVKEDKKKKKKKT